MIPSTRGFVVNNVGMPKVNDVHVAVRENIMGRDIKTLTNPMNKRMKTMKTDKPLNNLTLVGVLVLFLQPFVWPILEKVSDHNSLLFTINHISPTTGSIETWLTGYGALIAWVVTIVCIVIIYIGSRRMDATK